MKLSGLVLQTFKPHDAIPRAKIGQQNRTSPLESSVHSKGLDKIPTTTQFPKYRREMATEMGRNEARAWRWKGRIEYRKVKVFHCADVPISVGQPPHGSPASVYYFRCPCPSKPYDGSQCSSANGMGCVWTTG